jgi:hypothetical protein
MSWTALPDFYYNNPGRLAAKERYETEFPTAPYGYDRMVMGLIHRDEEIARLHNKIRELHDKMKTVPSKPQAFT